VSSYIHGKQLPGPAQSSVSSASAKLSNDIADSNITAGVSTGADGCGADWAPGHHPCTARTNIQYMVQRCPTGDQVAVVCSGSPELGIVSPVFLASAFFIISDLETTAGGRGELAMKVGELELKMTVAGDKASNIHYVLSSMLATFACAFGRQEGRG
jgi:hypothetical protein